MEKNIILIGFMGAGKTTIGKLLAEKLNRKFIDIDEEIEKEFAMPVSEIFNKMGERTFREKEKGLIIQLCEQKKRIISLGGGAFLQEEIRNVCLTSSIVIFLDISWESWEDRISLIINTRPVLQGKTIVEMEELFYQRQEIYSHHHFKVKTDNLDIEEIANTIVKIVKTGELK